ncbi:helix-turn-helix domain-containing protein [Rhodococcus sp. NPDC056960]|uniref:helix-turn-helix domain-containing protein n=1 Tax=Rhodococcus sp. NPDC056960 TaxID=3345982 RepID=UPI00362D92CF
MDEASTPSIDQRVGDCVDHERRRESMANRTVATHLGGQYETAEPPWLAYTIAEAARAVRMSDEYIRRQIKAGHLACRYAGRSVLIPVDELKSWLDSLPSER